MAGRPATRSINQETSIPASLPGSVALHATGRRADTFSKLQPRIAVTHSGLKVIQGLIPTTPLCPIGPQTTGRFSGCQPT